MNEGMASPCFQMRTLLTSAAGTILELLTVTHQQ